MDVSRSIYGFSEGFAFFSNGTDLTVYNNLNEDEKSKERVNVLDSLGKESDSNNDLKITSLYVQNLSKGNLLEKLNWNKEEVNPGEHKYSVLVALNSGLIVLYLYNPENKKLLLYYSYDLSDNSLNSDYNFYLNDDTVDKNNKENKYEVESVSLYAEKNVYFFFKLNGNLWNLNCNENKLNKLSEKVALYKVSGNFLVVFKDDGELEVTQLEEGEQGLSLGLNRNNLKDERLNEGELNPNFVSLLEKKNMLFFLLKDGVFYTFLDKLKLYQLGLNVPEGPHSYLGCESVNDLNVLVLAGQQTIQLWDFDTQNLLLECNANNYEFFSLNPMDSNNLNLVLFQKQGADMEFARVKVLINEDKFTLEDDNSIFVKKVESKEVEKNEKVKVDESEQNKRKMSEEDIKYKKLKKIKKNKFLDLESMEQDDDNLNNGNTINNNNLDNTTLNENLDNAEFEDNGLENEFDDEKDDYLNNLDNYQSTEMYGDTYSKNLMEELKRLKKRIKGLESKLYSKREPRVVMPGLCPRPSDKYRQWCLFWSECGHVNKQSQSENNTLNVFMFSGPFAGNFKKPDKYNCQLASLCVDGLVTGSNVSTSSLENNFKNDNLEGTKEKSSILSYTDLRNANDSWERRFKEEWLAGVAVAENFVATATTSGNLYVFSRRNLLLHVSRLKGRLRSLLAQSNLLAVVTEISHKSNRSDPYHHMSETNGDNLDEDANSEGFFDSEDKPDVVLNVKLMWINGVGNTILVGANLNNLMDSRPVNLFDDLLVLSGCDLKFIGLTSDYILWYIDTRGNLFLLLNNANNLNGLDSFEWVPTINIYNVHRNVYPLYVNNLQLCYIKLKGKERYPECSKNVDFMGYTLGRLNLRVDGVTSYYLSYSQFNHLLLNNPMLKDLGLGEGSKSERLQDNADNVPWQQYDEMRYSETLKISRARFLVKLTQLKVATCPALSDKAPGNRVAIEVQSLLGEGQKLVRQFLSQIGSSEKNHDKWLLRILRKIQLTKELYVNSDVIKMLKIPRCLEIAKSIVTDDKYKKIITDMLVLLQKSRQLMTT